MRLIQITDLHINLKEEIVHGVNTKMNFLKTLQDLKKISFDMLVITGDLSYFDGDIEVYQWIKKQLKENEITDYRIIGGNHDDPVLLSEVFGGVVLKGELYYFVEPNLIFLDTVKAYCSQDQLEWFEQNIKNIKDYNPVVFMHHPPFLSGVPHMDNKYAFEQSDIFAEICKKNPLDTYVFCGHYHNEISLIRDNINVFITPATYLQIYMFAEDFVVDHRIPAYRIIEVNDSINKIKTTVRYVFD